MFANFVLRARENCLDFFLQLLVVCSIEIIAYFIQPVLSGTQNDHTCPQNKNIKSLFLSLFMLVLDFINGDPVAFIHVERLRGC